MRRRCGGLALASLLALAGCVTTPSPPTPLPDRPSLAQAYAGRLRLGVAVEPEQLQGAQAALLLQQFNSLVAENAMKPSRLQPAEGRFRFERADAIADFARQHGLALRGHTLLWHQRTPDWFWRAPDGGLAERPLVLRRLQKHIDTVVGRYRDVVQDWDVVNEVIDASQPDCLRDNLWKQVVGPDYVAQAFRFARAADPAARLWINEFSTTVPAKRDCLARVLHGLLAQDVPVQGVGHQMHLNLDTPTAPEVEASLALFAGLGLRNQVTELDMSFYRPGEATLTAPPPALRTRQAERYAALMAVFLRHPELDSVTWWGLHDGQSHLTRWPLAWRADEPLLFDRALQPKPAWSALLQAAPGP